MANPTDEKKRLLSLPPTVPPSEDIDQDEGFRDDNGIAIDPTDSRARAPYGVDADAVGKGDFSHPFSRPPAGDLYRGPISPGKSYEGPLTTNRSDSVAQRPVDNLTGVLHSNVRGIRLNNFGNINNGDFCRSQYGYAGAESGNGGREAAFTRPEYGVLAADKLLDVYARQGRVTARDIISHWAPPGENDTAGYYNMVSQRLGISVDQPIPPDKRAALLSEIFRVENGIDPIGTQRVQFILDHRKELEAGVPIDKIDGWSALQGAAFPPTREEARPPTLRATPDVAAPNPDTAPKTIPPKTLDIRP